MTINCGGIKIDNYPESKNFNFKFSGNKYDYFFIKKSKLKNYKILLKSFTLYVVKKENYCLIEILDDDKKYSIKNGLQSENKNIFLSITGGSAEILIAGVKKNKFNKRNLSIFERKNTYKVTKPWGYEIWINGRHKNYAFKKIYIKKGYKTSLQYHNKKIETNFLYKGITKLHYSVEKKLTPNYVNPIIANYKINSKATIYVTAKLIHRLEALTHITLFEISTPHLDDVIRISDDSNRKDGLIKKEHL